MRGRLLRFVGLGAAVGAAAGYGIGLLLQRGQGAGSAGGSTPEQTPGTPAAPKPVADCPPAGARVLLLGDSHAQGLGPPMAALAASCATPFAHRAVVGSHVTQWAQDSWLGPALSGAPTVALVSLGANDFLRTDPPNVSAGITALVSKLRAAGVRVLWVAPVTEPFPDKIGVCAMWKQAVGDDWYDSSLLSLPRYGDGTHATPAGYNAWAGELWPWMSGLL